jgi:hypothetical protein
LNAHAVELFAEKLEAWPGAGLLGAILGASNVRLCSTLSVFAAALIGLVPLEAHAQDGAPQSASVNERPRPEYDPQGLRFGGFDVNANVDVGLATTDNLFATQTNKQSDLIYIVSPQATLASHWSRHALSVSAGMTRTGHQDFTSEDSTAGFVSGRARLDVGANTTINANARWAHEVEARTDVDSLSVGKPVEYDVAQGALSIAQKFNHLELSATAAHSGFDYHDAGPIDQDFRDSKIDTGTIRAAYAVSPRIGVLGQVSADHHKYANNPGLSSDGRTYLAGLTVNLTDLMQGQIAVGYFSRDYDLGERVDGAAVDASLSWYVTQLTTLSFNANRNAADQGATTNDPYIESRVGAGVDHELLRNLILSAGIQRGTRDYKTIDRSDDFTYAALGARYILNRRVALSANYRHDAVDSSGVNRYRNYDVNTFSLGLSLRL